MDKETLSANFILHPPAENYAILDAEKEFGKPLPEDYVRLLRITNGLSSRGNLVLLEIEDVVQRNKDYEVPEYMPEFVMIGDDSGGTAIVMKDGEPVIYEVDMGVMDPAFMTVSAASLEDLLYKHEGRTLSER